MAEQQEQNRSEEPTPFKLRRAREKGMVARSVELGFLGGLVAVAGFFAMAGPGLAQRLTGIMRQSFTAGIDRAANDPHEAQAMVGTMAWAVLEPLLLLGGTVVVVVAFLEILQLRGFIFSAQPLKPDFSRLNPAKGLKRLFSMRLLKETLKSLLKAVIYTIVIWLVIRYALDHYARISGDGERLAGALEAASLRLIFAFMLVALGFVLLDQMLVRREFLKQMRMSRREVTREARDREGDPRIKSKRKQLHAEFVKANQAMGNLAGSDLVIVNPEHFAVALRYDAGRMTAPEVTAKGRNAHALELRERAFRLGIPVLRRPALARAIYRACEPGAAIPADRYEAVADLYIQLQRERAAHQPD